MEYEILVWAGDTGEDVLYFNGGKRIDKARRVFKETIKKFPYRDIDLRKYTDVWSTAKFETLEEYEGIKSNSLELIKEN